MENLSTAHEEHLTELLQLVPVARDLLPYSDEFQWLKKEFWDRTFRKMTDSQLWMALVNVAKKGGVRGKRRSCSSPSLDSKQEALLLALLPVPLGERDRLPYTEKFAKMVIRFNQLSSMDLGERDVWLAVLRLAK